MLKHSPQNSLQSSERLFLMWCESLKQWLSVLSFNWLPLLESLWSMYFLMILSIKNGGYAFLIRLDLLFFMSLWKEFQLLQILNKLSIRHLIKLILYENDVKLQKFQKWLVQLYLWYVWSVRFWLSIPEMIVSGEALEWLTSFSIVNLMLGGILFKNFKTFNESCSFSKGARMLPIYLKWNLGL